MKKIASFLGIVFALTAFAGTQTSKEYVDKKDAEVFERAKTFTEEHVGNFENWARTEIGKIEETADQVKTNANLALEKASRASEDAERAVKNMYHGVARPLPRYLHALDFDDTYPDDAAWYYAQPQDYGGCSAVRDGGFLYRNYDWKFDDAAEFVVRMSAGPDRFASVGVANCGTNLTEEIVTSGKWSRYFKCLPGRTVDGINENGVVCEVNVVGGDPHEAGWPTNGTIHCLGAVRRVLDTATTARSAASDLVDHLFFPAGFSQNFHWMIADERETWVVENGVASNVTAVAAKRVMTNFPILPDTCEGEGAERYQLLLGGADITNAWWTLAYLPETRPIRYSDLGTNYESVWERWAEKPREAHRGEVSGGQSWWQTVHTSVYDISNRTLRICVQETDDWYTFAVGQANVETDDTVTRTSANPVKSSGIWSAIWGTLTALPSGFSSLYDWCVAQLADVYSLAFEAKTIAIDAANSAESAITGVNRLFTEKADRATTLSGYGITDGATTNGVAEAIAEADPLKRFYDYEGHCIYWENGVLKTGSFTDFEIGSNLKIYNWYLLTLIDGQSLPDYLASGDWNTASDPFIRRSEAPAPGNYAAVSNAAMNAIQAVTNADANLIYTITSDGAEPRFYFTPVGAINAED